MKRIYTILASVILITGPLAAWAQDDATPDISGEITTTEQAIQYAHEVVGVPDTPTLRIEKMDAQFSPKGNRWEILFRDGELTYDLTIEQDRDFDLDRDIVEEGNIPDFWQALPAPTAQDTPEQSIARAKEILLQFNPNFTATDRALFELETCSLPSEGRESDYANGCRSNETVQERTVFIEIETVVRGEEDKFFKAIIFDATGAATELTDASVSGNW